MKKRIVVALGHKALGTTLPEQKKAVKRSAEVLADIVEEGYQLAVCHSNAPQVGMIHTAMNEFGKKHPDYTCEAILNHYFNSNDVNCFSAKVDGKFPRHEMSKKNKYDIINEMRSKVGNLSTNDLVKAYSNWYYKNNSKSNSKDYLNIPPIYSFDDVKNLVAFYKNEFGEEKVRGILKELYTSSNNFAYFVNEADERMKRPGGFLNSDIDTKISNLFSYLNSIDNFKIMESEKITKDVMRKIDNTLNINVPIQNKVDFLTSTYNKNGNDLLEINSDINDQDVLISLVNNLLLVNMVSTNMTGKSKEEYIHYEGMPGKMQDILYGVKRVIDKIIGVDNRFSLYNLDDKSLYQNIKNLDENDISFMAWLYVLLRNNPKKINVLDNAGNKKYQIQKENSIEFQNTGQLLSQISKPEFINLVYNKDGFTIR